ncbi:hypothetical protein ACIBAI_22735 [Streptomyces sp. NPDC051041]|uniref:hypothetical protein n=1 Tax=Streptomyces sp. NPDC051041 TaxID=3365640 RepID=UPI0037B5CE57
MRAQHEAQEFAQQRGIDIVEVITDPYGEPDPCRREGWQRVPQLVESGAVGMVITRWPAAIAPAPSHELRYRETEWLRDHGAWVRRSWAPPAARHGEAV